MAFVIPVPNWWSDEILLFPASSLGLRANNGYKPFTVTRSIRRPPDVIRLGERTKHLDDDIDFHVDFSISSIVLYPDFRRGGVFISYHDLALIKLSQAVDSGVSYHLMCVSIWRRVWGASCRWPPSFFGDVILGLCLCGISLRKLSYLYGESKMRPTAHTLWIPLNYESPWTCDNSTLCSI